MSVTHFLLVERATPDDHLDAFHVLPTRAGHGGGTGGPHLTGLYGSSDGSSVLSETNQIDDLCSLYFLSVEHDINIYSL